MTQIGQLLGDAARAELARLQALPERFVGSATTGTKWEREQLEAIGRHLGDGLRAGLRAGLPPARRPGVCDCEATVCGLNAQNQPIIGHQDNCASRLTFVSTVGCAHRPCDGAMHCTTRVTFDGPVAPPLTFDEEFDL